MGSRGGVLREYNFDAQIPDSIDPHLTHFGPIASVHAAVFSRLYRYTNELTGTIAPDLAASMPEQPDETTYVVTLRDGVNFHDAEKYRLAFPNVAGRRLDASDVVYSFERQLSRNSPQANRFFRLGAWSVIDSISARDTRTIVFRLKAPVAPFVSFLAGRHAHVVARETVGAGDEMAGDLSLIGTGPFMLDTWAPGAVVKLRRNAAWHLRDGEADGAGPGRPFLEGYDAFFSPQEDLFQRMAFDRRAVDITDFTEPAALDEAHSKNLEDIALDEIDAGAVLASRFLLDRAPFKDDRVRRAIHLAIDRRGLISLLYPSIDGRLSARLSGPIPPGMPAWALDEGELANRPGYRGERAEDVTEAKELWAAALGDTPVGDLKVFFAGVPKAVGERASAFVQRQLSETLGAKVIPQVDASGTAVIAAALRRNVDEATEGVAPFTFMLEDGGVDLDDWLYPQFRSGLPSNTYRLQDATLDAQLEKQRATFDAAERAQLGRDIQEYLIGKVNARIEYCAPVERRLRWGYVRGARQSLGHGGDDALADTWLDTSHAAWAGRVVG